MNGAKKPKEITIPNPDNITVKAARGVPSAKGERFGEGDVKHTDNSEGGREERGLAMGQSRPCASVSPKGPGPREPYQMTAVTADHVRAVQAPCAQRDTNAITPSLDNSAQRTLNVRATYAERTIDVRRTMRNSTALQACSRVQFLLKEKLV